MLLYVTEEMKRGPVYKQQTTKKCSFVCCKCERGKIHVITLCVAIKTIV